MFSVVVVFFSGVYGVPKYVVADVACSSIDKYLSKTAGKTTLKEIYLVDVESEILHLMIKQMDNLVEGKAFMKTKQMSGSSNLSQG